jgi:molecular chaperone DnaK
VPQIEVTFDIDANGIVNVKAKDLGTNKEQSITITATNTLTDEEIDKMMKEAEAHKEEDNKKKEAADTKNEAEQVIFMTEKALKDLGDKVDKKDKEEAEDLIEKTKKALEGDDLDKIKSAKDELLKKANELATKVYEEAAKQNANSNDTSESTENDAQDTKKDDVVDAEYEEK